MGFLDSLLKKTASISTAIKSKGITNFTYTGFSIQALDDTAYLTEFDTIAKYNTYLAASIRKILENATLPELKIWNSKTETDVDNDLLILFEEPNVYQSYNDFIQYLLFSYLWDGNAYILKVKNGNKVVALLPLPFASVTVAQHGMDIIYKYNGNQYTREDIIHIKDSSYGNSYLKGESRIKHALLSIMENSYSDRFNISTLKSGGDIKGVLSTEANLTDEDVDLYSKSWDKRYAGVDNNGKTAVLGGGLKWTGTGNSMKDMGYASLKKVSREEVMSIMGVPQIILGFTESVNYANAQVQYKIFWSNTIKPLLQVMAASFTKAFLKGTNYIFYYDYSSIDALQEDLTMKLSQAQLAVSMGYSLRSVSEKLEIPFDIDDIVEDLGEVTNDSEIKPNNTSQRTSTESTSGDTSTDDNTPTKAFKKKIDSKQYDVWTNHLKDVFIKGHSKNEKRFRNDLEKFFVSIRNEIVNDLKGKKGLDDPISKDIMNNILKYLEDRKLLDKLNKISLDNFDEIGNSVVTDYLKEFDIQWKNNFDMKQITASHANNIAGIMTTTRKQIQALLNDAIDNNLSVGDVSQKLFDNFNLSRDRSVMIARTEITSLSNDMIETSFKQEGIEEKQWLTSEDGAVRESHSRINGETVKITDRFSNGLKYPGDSTSGNASEVVGCRCVLLPL